MAAAPRQADYERIADEQAALRRVATLVARATPAAEVFAAVAKEAGRLLGAHHATMSRYDPDGTARVVASWSGTGVGVPVSVEGRLWGVMCVASGVEPLPVGTEARLAGFTELAATAIANAQARVELRGFAAEQAALRRVATLVARTAQPEEVFAAVTEEAGRLVGADGAAMKQYDTDGAVTVVASWSRTGAAFPVGAWARLGGRNLQTLVFRTHQPARIDDYASATGTIAEAAHNEFGLRAGVGVPVSVEGCLWGVMIVDSRVEPLPVGAEARLAEFTELAATAVANAEAQTALTASRARIVVTADATRRRIERNLHDGAQQHLVSLTLDLRAAEAAAYYTVAEALTNAAKHAHATDAAVKVAASDAVLQVRIRDNGCGGASFEHGSGLVGLKDRAEALGGHLQLHSPPGAGTTLEITLPHDRPGEPEVAAGR